jgi:AcrR family transcriptional regulator
MKKTNRTPAPPPRKRLSKEERHEQLLSVALELVQREGTDALTLGHLAERAGVSKPIAYEHFETRSGLLVALARHIDRRQMAILKRALERAGPTLQDAARVTGAAYVRCYATVGEEWTAIVAALKGSDEMDAFETALVDSYVTLLAETFAPYTDLSAAELRLRCTAIAGAADAVARLMLRGGVSEAEAARTTAALMVGALPARSAPSRRGY